jgi:hypothetical protein
VQLVVQLLAHPEGQHEDYESVERHKFASEVSMETLTVIGLLLSLAQVVIALRRK